MDTPWPVKLIKEINHHWKRVEGPLEEKIAFVTILSSISFSGQPIVTKEWQMT